MSDNPSMHTPTTLRAFAAEISEAARQNEQDGGSPDVAALLRDWHPVILAEAELLEYLLEAHALGQADASAACTPNPEGVPVACRVIQLLKLAKDRGAFDPDQEGSTISGKRGSFGGWVDASKAGL